MWCERDTSYQGLLNVWAIVSVEEQAALCHCCCCCCCCYLWQRALFSQSALVHLLQQLFESVPDGRVVPLLTGQILQLGKTMTRQNKTQGHTFGLMSREMKEKKLNAKRRGLKEHFGHFLQSWIRRLRRLTGLYSLAVYPDVIKNIYNPRSVKTKCYIPN